MSIKSSVKTIASTVAEFHSEMVTECVGCQRPTIKSSTGGATLCATCEESDSFATALTVIFTGARRPQPMSTAVGRFIDMKTKK